MTETTEHPVERLNAKEMIRYKYVRCAVICGASLIILMGICTCVYIVENQKIKNLLHITPQPAMTITPIKTPTVLYTMPTGTPR